MPAMLRHLALKLVFHFNHILIVRSHGPESLGARGGSMRNYERLVAARDLLLRLREDLAAAGREFQWPRFEEFNWARDYFDVIARDNESPHCEW